MYGWMKIVFWFVIIFFLGELQTSTAWGNTSKPYFVVPPKSIAVEGEVYQSIAKIFVPLSDQTLPSFLLNGWSITQIGRETCCIYHVLLSWTPKKKDVGDYNLKVQTSVGNLSYEMDPFFVKVVPISHAPSFSSTPPLSKIAIGSDFRYPLTGQDEDNPQETLSFRLVESPYGSKITNNTLVWTPASFQQGRHSFLLQLMDSKGMSSFQHFELEVEASSVLPTQIVSKPPKNTLQNKLFLYPIQIQNAQSISFQFKLKQAPKDAEIHESTGEVSWVPDKTGSFSFEVEVTSATGVVLTQKWDVWVSSGFLPEVKIPANKTVLKGEEYKTKLEVSTSSKITYSIVKAPSGLAFQTLNNQSIQISWKTNLWEKEGVHTIVFLVDQEKGGHTYYSWDVVVEKKNSLPIVFSQPLERIVAGAPYQYPIRVQDFDEGDSLEFKLIQAPTGMTLSSDGLLLWNPTSKEVGTHSIRLDVLDSSNQKVSHSFGLEVLPKPQQPEFASTPNTSIDAGASFSYKILLRDADSKDQELTLRLLQAPLNLQLDSKNRQITWKPSLTDVGKHSIQLEVVDEQGLTAYQSFELQVLLPDQLILFTSIPPILATVNLPFLYQIKLNIPLRSEIQFSVLGLPAGAFFDSEKGTLLWTPSSQDKGKKVTFSLLAWYQQRKVAVQVIELDIREKNSIPTMNSILPSEVVVGKNGQWPITLSDPDGDRVSLQLLAKPENMNWDEQTQVLSWNPNLSDVGTQTVLFQIQDDRGGTFWKYWVVTVKDESNVFWFCSQPPLVATVSEKWEYIVSISREFSPLEFVLLAGPTGMVLDAATGKLEWTPTSQQLGSQNVVIGVKDQPNSSVQRFAVEVKAATEVPSFSFQARYSTTSNTSLHILPNASSGNATKDWGLQWYLLEAPSSMSIQLYNGRIDWKPQNSDEGSSWIKGKVVDLLGKEQLFSFFVDVLPSKLDYRIVSPPILIAFVGKTYQYQIVTSKSSALSQFRFLKEPQINNQKLLNLSSNGLISANPSALWEGKVFHVVVEAESQGQKASQSFALQIQPSSGNTTDLPPVWSQTPPAVVHAKQNVPYVFALVATDPEKKSLRYGLKEDILGARIETSTGLFTFLPSQWIVDQLPIFSITVFVEDEAGNRIETTFQIRTENENEPPFFSSLPNTRAQSNNPYIYPIQLSDPDGVLSNPLSLVLVQAPKGMVLNTNQQLFWSPTESDQGNHLIHLRVTDSKGASSEQKFYLQVHKGETKPEFLSTPPLTAQEGELYRYALQIKGIEEGNVRLLSAPKGMVLDAEGSRITWLPDKSASLRGSFLVSIVAENKAGKQTLQEFTLQVKGKDLPPILLSSDCEKIQVGQLSNCLFLFQDPDGESFRLEAVLERGPVGSVIQSTKRAVQQNSFLFQQLEVRFSWTPAQNEIGNHVILLKIEDRNRSYYFPFSLEVSNQQEIPKAVVPSNATMLPGQLELDGSQSSDPAGRTLYYQWKFLSGPQTITIDFPFEAKSKVLLRASGQYVFELVVFNGIQYSPPARMLVQVQNVAPSVQVLYSYGGAVGSPVFVDASQVHDSNQDEITLDWKCTSHPNLTFSLSNNEMSFTPQEAGIYTFRIQLLEKKDGAGTTSYYGETVSLFVHDVEKEDYIPYPHVLPIVEDAWTQKTYSLDGRQSWFGENPKYQYQWKVILQPPSTALDSLFLGETNLPLISFSSNQVGVFQLSLRLVGKEETLPFLVHFDVENPRLQKQIPVAIVRETVGQEKNWVEMDGSQSSAPQGEKLVFHWKQINGPAVELLQKDSSKPRFWALEAAHYDFELIVENNSIRSRPLRFSIWVQAASNPRPVVVVSADKKGSNAGKTNSPVALSAKGTYDPKGGTLRYFWKQTQGFPVVLKNAKTSECSFTTPVPGIYSFSLQVSDGKEWTAPKTVRVVVHSEKEHIPEAHAGIDQNIKKGELVVLDGSQSKDLDGDSLTYHWKLLSPRNVSIPLNLSNPASPSFASNSLTDGIYVWELQVHDGKYLSLKETVTIRVFGNNQLPVAKIDRIEPISLGDEVVLNGSNSFDADGDKLQYIWTQESGPSIYLSNQGNEIQRFIPSQAGDYRFRLEVFDGVDRSFPAYISFTVQEGFFSGVGCSCSSSRLDGDFLWAWLGIFLFLGWMRQRS